MSVRVADPRAKTSLPEVDLLARLGLRPGASNDQIEAAHDEILDYLRDAPGSLRDWVRGRIFEVDEAYGLLNGATVASTVAAAPAIQARPAPKSLAVATSGSTAQVRVRSGSFDDGLAGDALDGWPDEINQPIVVTRRDRRQVRMERRDARPASASVTIDRRTLRRTAFGGAILVAAAIAVFAIFKLGDTSLPGITGSPAPTASAAGLDTAAVAADMAKLATNPKDIATLQDLANLYYAAGDYPTAQTWLDKVLALDPKNIPALLGYGAAAYNLDDFTTAEAKWQAVVAIDAKNIEAHYDLGFMYFSQTPPNIAGVKSEWAIVLTLNPDADLKTYIQAHLASLDAVSSGQPSAAPSGAPASAAPASPAPSPAAS
jgi:cytochrome c-type biogenesis protein CcmH/NrfG